MANYNPFNASGRYNFENFLYSHKKQALALVSVIIFLLGMILVLVWLPGDDQMANDVTLPKTPEIASTSYKTNKPSAPTYGYGPDGFDLYPTYPST